MDAARIEISHRQRSRLAELTLETDGRLDRIRRPQVWINLVGGGQRGRAAADQRADGGYVGEEIWIRYDVLLLEDAVEPFRLKHVALREAIVENPETGAQDHLGLRAVAKAPGQPNARREVGVIANVVLRFEAQAETQSHVAAHAPIILAVDPYVEQVDRGQGCSRGDGEQVRSA